MLTATAAVDYGKGRLVLYRDDPDGLVTITQPAHAWVTGQLARAWGNARFPRPKPWEEVCLAAERHDDGWLAWEAAPTLDSETGQPFSFLALPRAEHLAIWSAAGPMTVALGRYPALLVSLHGSGLYERHDPAGEPAGDAEAVRAFLDQQHAFQARLLSDLQEDPHYAAYAAPEAIARNRRLIAVWDVLSLAVCGGQHDTRKIGGVPTVDSETALSIAVERDDPTRITIAPWPFTEEAVTVHFEGRRLSGRFTDEAMMRAMLARAPWTSFEVRLNPAAGDDDGHAPIRGLGEIALRVQDLAAMRAFYEQVVGLELMQAFPHAVFFRIAGDFEGHTQILALFDRSATLGYGGLSRQQTTLDHLAFAISVRDFATELARLESLGLEVSTTEHAWVHWRSLYVADPEGNRVELVCYDATA